MKCYIDTETCGLHGVPVIVQYAFDDGPVNIHNFWTETIGESLDLIELFLECECIFFNAAFDFFHLYKIYTMFVMFGDRNAYPELHIDELGIIEERARFSDICIKPKSVCDIMLHARKGPYQSLMARDPIVIRRVPTALAYHLRDHLERTIKFDQIYFAKSKDEGRWKIYDILKSNGDVNPDFKTIKLHFRASGALKSLYKHVFKETTIKYADIEVDRKFWPEELGYAPFALALAKADNWGKTWPGVIRHHISHWNYNEQARTYASNDILYTRRLYTEHFGSPEPGDNDSILACMVACCRWSGYFVDVAKLTNLKAKALAKLKFDPYVIEKYKNKPVTQSIINKFGKACTDPRAGKRYLLEVMVPEERLAFEGSTKKDILIKLVTWKDDDGNRHPVADRAQEILDARMAKKEIEVYDKILRAKRFHASFKVIGALSSRMSGADGLNPQGINHEKFFRECFPLADDGTQAIKNVLCGGDYKAFEVSIAATVFNDPDLYKIITSGIKLHALFATKLFPELTYEEVIESDGKNPDYYDKGKKGIFSYFYGGEAYTLVTRLNVNEENAMNSITWLKKEFKGIKRFDTKINADFGALSQPGGIGTKIEWRDPKDYVSSFLGFKRYFTLENRVMRQLFDLAQDPPKHWRDIKIKVLRRDRVQTATGAVASALYGAAFGIMSRNIRAAKNHEIQSPGAMITKATQANIWSLQPQGVNPWIVKPMNVHDEIMAPVRPGYEEAVKAKATETVDHYKQHVPLLAIDWFTNIPNWANKKG